MLNFQGVRFRDPEKFMVLIDKNQSSFKGQIIICSSLINLEEKKYQFQTGPNGRYRDL